MPQYELNLRDYLRIFRKRRFSIVAVFLLVTLVSGIYLYSQPHSYKADVTVKIEERKTIAGLLTEWIMYNPGDVMESQTKVIMGYPIMKKVALRLGMLEENAPVDQVNAVVSRLQGNIQTERVSQTNMIRIIASSADPKEAMDLANAVSEAYIEENLLEKAKQARHVRVFIEDQLTALEDRIKVSEERVKSMGGSAQSARLADPIQDRLINLQFELAELLQRYTDKHPRVIRLQEQIKELEARLSTFSQPDELEYSRLNREVEVNKKLYAMLKEKLEEARINEAQKVGDISVVNPAFLPESPVSGNRLMKFMVAVMMGLLLGFTFAFVFETLDTSISTIEDVERVVKLSILGIIPSIGEEFKSKKGLLASLSEMMRPHANKNEAEEKLIRLVAHYQPQSSAAEAYRNVLTNLKPDSRKKTVLVTSSGAREGKSTVVSNLGIVMAQTGLKTLLVSADLRRPVLAKIFGIKKEPGLSEYLMGAASLDSIINSIADILVGNMDFEDARITPGLENISIIASGKLPYNPVKLLGSREVAELIEALKARFDCIIFDAPPVLPVTDANLLAPKMDAVVLVYEIGRTSREALMRTKSQLESVGAKITGIVLNNTQSSSEAISLYPYYSRYKYKYYTKGQEEEGKAAKIKRGGR